MKESWDNARDQISSALIVFKPSFNIGSFSAVTR